MQDIRQKTGPSATGHFNPLACKPRNLTRQGDIMRYLTLYLLLSVIGTVTGCATITTGTDQSVTVMTEKDVAGASCELSDSRGGKWFVNNTPGTVSVHKGDGPMTVICRKQGYLDTILSVEETVAGATLGNVILGGGVGIIVDAMSGSAQRYPDQIVVWMEPEEWESESFRKEWEQEKQAYEEFLKEQNSPRQESQTPFGK